MAYESSPKRKLQGRRVPISTYVDEDVFDALTELAARHERSLAGEIRRAINAHLKAEAPA